MTSPKRPKGKMTSREIIFCFVALLVLAGFFAYCGIDSPIVWSSLVTVIGLLFRKGLR
jgi:hypothetical protein